MLTEKEALARVRGVLDDVAARIRALEADSLAMLEKGDAEASASNMRAKAELLAELPELLDPFMYGLGPEARGRVERDAEGFSLRAMAALEQGSVFWMRNLLYAEDHVEGRPNDLELFAASLAETS